MFTKELKKKNIDPDQYLKQAKKQAKASGLDPTKLKFAEDPNKKLTYEGVNFGAAKYNDYIIYKLKDDVKADDYRERYQKSHKAIKGDWKNKLSPNALSLKINW